MDNQTLSIKPRSGYGFVYCYTSPSGKKYIGQTRTTLKERAKLNAKGYMGCTAFYNAIQKYGWENFSVEILEEVPLDVLNETEINYILDYDTINPKKGYNIMQERYEYLASLRRVPVYSYDGETGVFIKRYNSISEAEREMEVHNGSIRRILNELNHHVRGKVWMTEQFEKVEVVKNNIQATSQKVYMYDKATGAFLQEFSSLREAARETGHDRNCLRNQIETQNTARVKIKHLFRNFKVDNLYDESSTTIPSGVGSSEPKEE